MDAALRIVTFVALAGLMFIPLERLFGRAQSRSGRLTDLGFATLGELLVLAALVTIGATALAALDVVAVEDPIFVGIHHSSGRKVAEVAVGLFVFELVGYAYHRAAHRVPALWRLHRVHHSSGSMDWLASFRQHPLEILLVTLAQNAPLVLVGLPLGAHVMVLLLLKLNTVFVHANIVGRMGWWRHLVATPHFHHRHHQQHGAARNYAAMFPWLDRMFGTFEAETAGPVGLPEPTPAGFWGLLAMPFRRLR